MGVVVAVDPGVKKAAFAVFVDGVLVKAQTVMGPCAEATADAILVVVGSSGHGADWVIEQMVKYKGRSETHHDLERVEQMVKHLCKVLRRRKGTVKRVKPSAWKGNAPKGIIKNRIKDALNGDEPSQFRDQTHDTYDAVGIGLVATGRCRRGVLAPR